MGAATRALTGTIQEKYYWRRYRIEARFPFPYDRICWHVLSGAWRPGKDQHHHSLDPYHTGNAAPVCLPPRRLPLVQRDAAQKAIPANTFRNHLINLREVFTRRIRDAHLKLSPEKFAIERVSEISWPHSERWRNSYRPWEECCRQAQMFPKWKVS